MAVSYVTYAVAGSTTATVTGVQVGDLIVVMATGSSIPGLPAGWTSLLTANPGIGVRVGYKVATAAGSQQFRCRGNSDGRGGSGGEEGSEEQGGGKSG